MESSAIARLKIVDLAPSWPISALSPALSYYCAVNARILASGRHAEVLLSVCNHYAFLCSRSKLNALWIVGPAPDRWVRWHQNLEDVSQRIAMRKCDLAIVVSETMRDWFNRSKMAVYFRGQVVKIPNAVDPAFYRRYQDPDNSRVLFVGALAPGKGVEYLVDAIPSIIHKWPSSEFTIVGGLRTWGLGWIDYAKSLRSKLQTLSSMYPGKIEFLLDIGREELLHQYNRASVLVVPSVWPEPGALTVLEAMACEVPVVGSDSGSIPEYVENGRTGLIARPKDSRDIADAVVSILSDAEKAHRFGTNARRLVKEKYTWEKHSERLGHLFRDYLDL